MVESADTENVAPILGQRSRFVKTTNIDLARNINPVWRNAKDARAPETVQCKARVDGERPGSVGGTTGALAATSGS
jgi:hypothetical protein